jgi:hypothetical protein
VFYHAQVLKDSKVGERKENKKKKKKKKNERKCGEQLAFT